MKYIKALSQKGLNKSDLSKTIQSKIDSLENLLEKIRSADIDSMTDSQLEEHEDAKKAVIKLDGYVTELIKKFDPEAYKVRLKKQEVMMQKVAEKKAQPAEETPKAEAPKDEESEKINKKLEELKQTVQVDVPKFQATPSEAVEVETEDLGTVKKIKPRKMSTSLILMGVGAFFLTWGAVNFFKDRR